MKQIYRVFLTVCVFSFIAHSQIPGNSAEQRRQDDLQKQKVEGDLQERMRDLNDLNRGVLPPARTELIVTRRKTPETKEERAVDKEQQAIIEATLSPNPDDASKHKTFLKQSNTGMFRLFPDFDCQPQKLIVRVDGDCANQIPGTWFYSFRQKNYSNATLFDVRLKNENLIAGAFLSQGILVQLGDVPLEGITLASNGLKFLVNFKPETQDTEIKKQFLQIEKGIEFEGYEYSKTIKPLENMTYAMRVVAYRSENKSIPSSEMTAENVKLLAVSIDKRKDLILAFRIIRKEADGNITILWKELARRDSPKVVFK